MISSFFKELEFRQEKGYISKSTLILCVEDPHVKVGSGGATLNALLVVAEHLSALSGHTVNEDFNLYIPYSLYDLVV